jgi:hypothetical protein
MNRCNYCTWKRLESQGYRIATKEDLEKLPEKVFPGGVTVVNPKGEFARWFMELPPSCRC